MKTKLTNLLNGIILVFFLSGCEVPFDGKEEIYREDGTLEQVDTYEDGVISTVERYSNEENVIMEVTFDGGIGLKS